ncbi:MAG: hypothetical protein HOC28_08625 [Bacteroidetes Order II. Incertae sedis bacterium]|jgi:hypothetical protein|nr:hypothetical protein [Bacteroidetes Order II. bacterium]MDG1754687.1 hypothetical protein [Rhodothermales bacterium]HAY36049.1 hypothetical protein [Bacteroidota bacterium]MBT4052739.1 hypothetical protein [Bacteroidetes Order II. bacterium]MBT4603190.1 hypothetical protein [Bacteroidetes Order II. bacterium]
MEYLFVNWWVWIPIVAILAGTWKEVALARTKAAQLGSSTESLDEELKKLSATLSKENEALTKRIQNLEAIVTSVEWDDISTKELPVAQPRLVIEPEEPSDVEKAAHLAKKVR